MKATTFAMLTGAASSMILCGSVHAAYTGLYIEWSDNYFSNHPNQAIRDAWNAGPVNQYDIYRLYANFNTNTPADRVNFVQGAHASPLSINVFGGTLYNYTVDHHGKTSHFNAAYTGVAPVERSWDTWVTIGNAMNGGATGLTPGFGDETNNLGHEAAGFQTTNAAWFVTPMDAQGQAVASAPGQANAPPGTYRVLLAQIVVTQGSNGITGNFLINVNGQSFPNQAIFMEPPIVHGDATGDNVVNVNDLLAVINAWGACPQPCSLPCSADVAPPFFGDCVVDVSDLLLVINNWSP